MTSLRKISRLALALLCLLPLAADASAAEKRALGEPKGGGLEIVEVRIYARDAATKEDLAWVNPGDTLILPQRAEVRLRIEAIPRNKGPRYPSASFSVNESRPVAGIARNNAEMGSATLQSYGRTGNTRVHYTILDNSLAMANRLRRNSFVVKVEASSPEAAPESAEDETLFEAFYRGILLRSPEPAALRAGTSRLDRGGYTAAVEMASEIARSEESLGAVARSTPPEERLEALYRHLLGVERSDADPDQWQSDMRWMRSENLNQVVTGMVRSELFRERFGFQAERGVRYRN